MDLIEIGRTTWTGDQSCSKAAAQTEESRTDIHASTGIRTHDRSVCVGEDIAYLRPRGHCDRPNER
jgi:hypothetical protein